jgi:hypothetical protein
VTEETPIQKSLIEQIVDEMFVSLEARKEFGTQIVQELKQLAIRGELKKAPRVAKAIKVVSEERHESA